MPLALFALLLLPSSAFPVAHDIRELERDVRNSARAVWGLKKTLMTHFQSCAVIDTRDGKPAERLAAALAKEPLRKNCVSRTGADFAWLEYGRAKPVTEKGEIRLDAFQRLWCSGYLGTGYAASGLNFVRQGHARYVERENRDPYDLEKNKDPFLPHQPVTAQIHRLVFGKNENSTETSNPESCLKVARFSREHSLLPGDFLVRSSNHIVQVLEVGKDPLGLKEKKSAADCEAISQKDLDFTFTHSSNSKGGVVVEAAKDSVVTDKETGQVAPSSILKYLLEIARASCRQMIKNTIVKAPVVPSGVAYDDDKVVSFTSVLRNKFEAGCTYQPVKLAHEECVAECVGKLPASSGAARSPWVHTLRAAAKIDNREPSPGLDAHRRETLDSTPR